MKHSIRIAGVIGAIVVVIGSFSVGSITHGLSLVFPYEGGNFKTDNNSAVYHIEDGKRRPFPTKAVFDSYGTKEKPKLVPNSYLYGFPIGEPMPVKAGTAPIQFEHRPEVYVSLVDGKIIHLKTAEAAIRQFGVEWEKHIILVPELFSFFYEEVQDACVSFPASCVGVQ